MVEPELKAVLDMLDEIITSNNPQVHEALREAAVMAALTKSPEQCETEAEGPIASLVTEVNKLRRSLRAERRTEESRYGSHVYEKTGTWPDPVRRTTRQDERIESNIEKFIRITDNT